MPESDFAASNSTRCRRAVCVILSAIAAVVLSGPSICRADVAATQPIQLVTSKVTANPITQTITFALTFDRVPFLQEYNEYGNAADEFAIDILNMPLDHESLFGAGGEDVRWLSSTFRINGVQANHGRVSTPPGFSAITTPRFQGSYLERLVPVTVLDTTVTLTASFAALHETDGLFEATFESYRYGAWSGHTIQIGTVFADPDYLAAGTLQIPEPAAGAVVCLGTGALLLRRRRWVR